MELARNKGKRKLQSFESFTSQGKGASEGKRSKERKESDFVENGNWENEKPTSKIGKVGKWEVGSGVGLDPDFFFW
jgi:hypothetical protein